MIGHQLHGQIYQTQQVHIRTVKNKEDAEKLMMAHSVMIQQIHGH